MDKKYRVIAYEIYGESEEKVLDEEYTGFTLYGDKGDRFSEVMMHENVLGLASKLAQGNKSKVAVKLANFLDTIRKSEYEDMEDELLDLIGGMDE